MTTGPVTRGHVAALVGAVVMGTVLAVPIPAQAQDNSDCLIPSLALLCPPPTTKPPKEDRPPEEEPPPAPPPGPGQPGGGTPPPGDPGAPPEAGDPGEGEGDQTPPEDAGPFPANLRRQMNSVRRSGPSNTQVLLDALAPLGQFGLTPEQAVQIGFGRFPVAGYASYVHDWWFPRFGPGWRLHMGTDVFAAYGTPIRAPSAGVVSISNGGLGGLVVKVNEPDGTYWYLAHLSGIPDGIEQGMQVAVGQVVAFVGDSGNAKGGSPHLHIGRYVGGRAVDPKAMLDEFLAEAVAGAPQLIASMAQQAGVPVPELATPGPPDLSLAGPERSALLWASAASPTGGALQLAEAEAMRAVADLQWDPGEAGAVTVPPGPLTPPLLGALVAATGGG